MQADAFDGYNQLYKAQRKPVPILEAACWSHGRRKFVDLVKQGEAPIASEAVRRIDMLFEIERSINGQTPAQRLAVRRERSRPLVAELEIWMRQQRALLSTKNDTAKAINYLLNRWAAFIRFLDDGRVCLTNNAAERALRGVAVGRSLTARPPSRSKDLLPWNYKARSASADQATHDAVLNREVIQLLYWRRGPFCCENLDYTRSLRALRKTWALPKIAFGG